jgi:hypothetical protein
VRSQPPSVEHLWLLFVWQWRRQLPHLSTSGLSRHVFCLPPGSRTLFCLCISTCVLVCGLRGLEFLGSGFSGSNRSLSPEPGMKRRRKRGICGSLRTLESQTKKETNTCCGVCPATSAGLRVSPTRFDAGSTNSTRAFSRWFSLKRPAQSADGRSSSKWNRSTVPVK